MTLCRVLSLLAGLVSTPTPALQFYHNHNIHNNENTGQIAQSAYARNETPSAKMAISSDFGMMLSLFSVAGLSRPPCLITTPHPSAGRYPFAVASGVRSRFAVGFPIPCGAFCCSGWFASRPGSQDGQRMSQTDFSDSLQPAGHCDRVSPNPDNAHAVEVLRWPDAIPA